MRQLLIWLSGGLFMIGTALAGSEGDWMPWTNLVGVALVFASVLGLERLTED